MICSLPASLKLTPPLLLMGEEKDPVWLTVIPPPPVSSSGIRHPASSVAVLIRIPIQPPSRRKKAELPIWPQLPRSTLIKASSLLPPAAPPRQSSTLIGERAAPPLSHRMKPSPATGLIQPTHGLTMKLLMP